MSRQTFPLLRFTFAFQLGVAALLAALATSASCDGEPAAPPISSPAPTPRQDLPRPADHHATLPNRAAINPRLLRRFRPIAQPKRALSTASADRIALGRMLWYEPRLSADAKVSCNSCHDLARYGVDQRPRSLGVAGRVGRRNSPTVYNAADHLAQFWDGRAGDLEQQALGPLFDRKEMAASRPAVEEFLQGVPEYRARFAAAFPDAPRPTVENLVSALAAFERGLVTTSRWDQYLTGDRNALSDGEIQGLRVFLEVGCMGCHTGPQVGASMFQVAGFMERWPNQSDQGRFEVTKLVTDRMVFKVPTLKNITETAPYFHDGSCADLPKAVRLMGKHQLGIELGEHEVSAIVEFFGALRGALPVGYIARPPLPGNDIGTVWQASR